MASSSFDAFWCDIGTPEAQARTVSLQKFEQSDPVIPPILKFRLIRPGLSGSAREVGVPLCGAPIICEP
jgi:hypothetical protein